MKGECQGLTFPDVQFSQIAQFHSSNHVPFVRYEYLEALLRYWLTVDAFCCLHGYGYISGFTLSVSLMVHESVFCSYWTVFVTVALCYALKSGIVVTPSPVGFDQYCFGYLQFSVFPCEFYDPTVQFYSYWH